MFKAKHLYDQVKKCKNVLKQLPIQVVMYVYPTVSELRFYGPCHPCFFLCFFVNIVSFKPEKNIDFELKKIGKKLK